MSNRSSPPSHRGLTNLERTRQQLQDLDSLLQQMLALPSAEPAPESAASPPASPAAEPAAATDPLPPAATQAEGSAGPKRLQTLLTSSCQPAELEPSAELKRPLPLPALQTPAGTLRELAPPGMTVAPVPTDLDPALMDLSGPASFDLSSDQEVSEAAAPWRTWGSGATQAPAKRPLLYRSLVGFDATLDWTLGLLGPLGRPLTSESGKAWLGWLGLVCLLGAAALAVGLYLGWTW